MRLSSPASLKGLKVSPAIKAQIEREFQAQEQAKGKPPSPVASQLSREQLKAVMPQEILSRRDRARCGVFNYLGTASASRAEQWIKKHS